MPFDRESGQIYDESFKALPKKDEDDVVYVEQRGHARKRPRNRSSTQGTRSLYRMAMLTVLRSLDLLYPDVLQAYPLPILEQIWRAIKQADLAGLRMWKLFAPVHMADRRLVKRPQSTFVHAIGQGSSSECAWLTDLTLDAIPLSMADYMNVSSMPNLASLVVIAGAGHDTDFSDRVLRAWDSDAKTGSFSKLQHMFVSGHRYVTAQSLAYLEGFKMLQLFCAHNCRFDGSLKANATNSASDRWHDHPNGKFRSFLKTESANLERRDNEAPLPSSFHAYVALCRRSKDLSPSNAPRLLMSLLPEPTQSTGIIQSRYSSLHCFERCETNNRSMQLAKERSPELKHKRRKLKDGRARDLSGVLEGIV